MRRTSLRAICDGIAMGRFGSVRALIQEAAPRTIVPPAFGDDTTEAGVPKNAGSVRWSPPAYTT